MSLFPQYFSQGSEEHAVPGQLPGPQHALPPRAADGKGRWAVCRRVGRLAAPGPAGGLTGSAALPRRTWSSAPATSPTGSLLSCTAALCTAPRRRCMSHLPPPPLPCCPTPAPLASALLPCLGVIGCHFSSSSPREACPFLLPQPFFLRAPSPRGLPGALMLTWFCLLQMDLPFLEASALRFGLSWGGGVLPGPLRPSPG